MRMRGCVNTLSATKNIIITPIQYLFDKLLAQTNSDFINRETESFILFACAKLKPS